jgi:predicted PurR-regulated permease PerM
MNQIKNFDTYFFFLVLSVGTVGVFSLLQPFTSAIFVAALFALMFAKPYKIILKIFKNKLVSAILACFLVAFMVVLPFSIIISLVGSEISDITSNFTNGETTKTQQKIQNSINSIYEFKILNNSLSQLKNSISDEEITNFFKNAANKSLDLLQVVYQNAVKSIVWVFVMFFTLFYFFIDGDRFVRKIMRLSPMKNRHEKLLIDKFVSTTRATLKGTLIIGTIQGSLGGLAFWIAGIPSPIIWTMLMVFISIIPAAGASMVVIPAGIVMLILGNFWQGIFLMAMGVFVSMIDNVIRPKLVGNDTQIHGLLVFFATIGGLSVFGLIGFIVGPIIMALGIALWEIYAVEFKSDLENYNGK